ncbi:unnamed protein product [Coccothraustes coccothraustes]
MAKEQLLPSPGSCPESKHVDVLLEHADGGVGHAAPTCAQSPVRSRRSSPARTKDAQASHSCITKRCPYGINYNSSRHYGFKENWRDPPSENAGVHLVKRMDEINNQGKDKIKMKNEENITNKNFQVQKILGKAVT